MSEDKVGLSPEPAEFTEEALRARYEFLKIKVEKTEDQIAPLKAELKAAADEAEKYRVKAMEVAKRLREARGGDAWFAMKREIGRLAKALGGK
jgi:predicted RNase H-like nuclease (RuvC/YqgF family)